jgi:hypothetical protein
LHDALALPPKPRPDWLRRDFYPQPYPGDDHSMKSDLISGSHRDFIAATQADGVPADSGLMPLFNL